MAGQNSDEGAGGRDGEERRKADRRGDGDRRSVKRIVADPPSADRQTTDRRKVSRRQK